MQVQPRSQRVERAAQAVSARVMRGNFLPGRKILYAQAELGARHDKEIDLLAVKVARANIVRAAPAIEPAVLAVVRARQDYVAVILLFENPAKLGELALELCGRERAVKRINFVSRRPPSAPGQGGR